MTKVLYIDDDAGLRRLVQRWLEREGYAVETAASGHEGIERIRQGGIDAVAMDHYMPDMDGLETLGALRALDAVPPVIFVTAAEDSRIAVGALKAGASDYVLKDVRGDFIPLLRVAIESSLNAERLKRARDRAEEELRTSRDRYAALAAERELLLREVNHRVGNSLQLVAAFLHMQASGAGDAAVKEALLNAMGRVVAVGHVHRRLYTSGDVESVDMANYLASFVEDLKRSSHKPVEIQLQAEDIELDADRAVAIGVIVNELVLNALKYAYPQDGSGVIRVGLTREGASVTLFVDDDGIGYDASSVSGLGGRIVRAMATKLGGNVEHRSKSPGACITVSFTWTEQEESGAEKNPEPAS